LVNSAKRNNGRRPLIESSRALQPPVA